VMSSVVVIQTPRHHGGYRRRCCWRSALLEPMNSPYYYLMEMGIQTNKQPLLGSAPQALINPAAETLMALISQPPRCLYLSTGHGLAHQSGLNQTQPQRHETLCSYLTWSSQCAPSLSTRLCRETEAESSAGLCHGV
jgi:hypothetical protein